MFDTPSAPPRPFRRRTLAAAIAALPLALCGCDDPAVERAPRPGEDVAAATVPAWLEIGDTRSPAAWLVARGGARADEDREERLEAGLAEAGRVFHDSRRMLANRIAQLVDLCAEEGDPQPAERVLADLTVTPADDERLWFGVVAQAYVELRRRGGTHADAAAAVRRTFGREGGSR